MNSDNERLSAMKRRKVMSWIPLPKGSEPIHFSIKYVLQYLDWAHEQVKGTR